MPCLYTPKQYTPTYTCIHTYIHLCSPTHTFIHLHIHTPMHTTKYTPIYTPAVYMPTYTYIHLYTYCIYSYTPIYTHTYMLRARSPYFSYQRKRTSSFHAILIHPYSWIFSYFSIHHCYILIFRFCDSYSMFPFSLQIVLHKLSEPFRSPGF